jgi:hypothetical protein
LPPPSQVNTENLYFEGFDNSGANVPFGTLLFPAQLYILLLVARYKN